MSTIKGLTITMVFEAESANYGEGVGNVTSLKKISRDGGRAYTYISRQALRYNIIGQMGVDNTPLDLDGEVLQFHPDATIKDYPEIDLFGYMKTQKPVKTRAAVARLSNAVALETFNADLDFLTNKGLLDRYNETAEKKKDGGNIAQSEIHKSYYSYTITVDLDKVGIDILDKVNLDKEEKTNRVVALLDAVKFLYRDIKGRRENLSPILAIGGVYSIKNPFFENRVKCYNNTIDIEPLMSVKALGKEVSDNTKVGLIKGIFRNSDDIVNKLSAVDMAEFFDSIKNEVKAYYEV
ncbi:type I-B CRISPR-associated protein Cas7/Cst2/DevR [Clostridium magnum]|uniref:CRISPR-associated negative autoregulator DevR/Csa2 n=1 Tax=Clostridium magnum DSM 2767 TaxID=1121326 RepID=A0A162SU40_9CLOT|nr:type I-B CRISPR-associated protein Cas7/Cst2/DevR [Clostridium magnum]KZL91869.1 CRISPR-associated negative autoregulator DevR/Csa2 [Clostridium magnum DSM 2767]SHI25479.1 CRISPR-associated autoregulator, Cst2 family [Clostridium magnum DSM 2767]